MSGEAQAVGDVAHAQLVRPDETLVLATERRTRCAVRRVCHASSRETVVVQELPPVLDANPAAVRAVFVALVLLERSLRALPAKREITDCVWLLSVVEHTLDDRDSRRTHGRVALEHPSCRVVGRPRGDLGRNRSEPRLGVRCRVAAIATYCRLHVWVVASDNARQTQLLAEPVLVVAGRACLTRGLVRCSRCVGRASKTCYAETDVAARLLQQLMPLVLQAMITRRRSRRRLVAAFNAGGAVLAVSRCRVRRLVVSWQALDAISWSASTLSGARSVHARCVARRGYVRAIVAHARGGRIV